MIYADNTRLSRDIRTLETSVIKIARMHEALSRRSDRLLEESLQTHRMGTFLFEAEKSVDVGEAASSLDMAIETADKVLKSVEETADQLNSAAIKEITSNLRDKLQKVALEGRIEPEAVKDLQKSDGEKKSKIAGLARDASNFVLDKLGYTTKQLTFITQSLANANKTIISTIKAVNKMLKDAKIDITSPVIRDKSIDKIFLEEDADAASKNKLVYKDSESLKDALVKVIKGSFGEAKGIFAKLKSFLEGAGAEPVNLDPEKFASDIMKTKFSDLEAWSKSQAAKIAQKPDQAAQQVLQPIGAATAAAGTTPKAVVSAQTQSGMSQTAPSSSGVTKIPLKSDVLKALPDEEFKSQINQRAEELGAKGKVIERRLLTTRTSILTERWAKLAGIESGE